MGGGTPRLSNCCGFTISTLVQLSSLVANVTTQGTNFIHYLVTMLQDKKPYLLDLPKEMPHLQDASKIAFADIVKDIEKLKKSLDEFRNQLQQAKNPPLDLAEQMNSFLPVADAKLIPLISLCKEVEEKSKIVAEYFCDERKDFIVHVFGKVWKFVEEFTDAKKHVSQNQPITLPWVSKPEETKGKDQGSSQAARKLSISAIIEDKIGVLTPPLSPENQSEPELVFNDNFQGPINLPTSSRGSLTKQRGVSLSSVTEGDYDDDDDTNVITITKKCPNDEPTTVKPRPIKLQLHGGAEASNPHHLSYSNKVRGGIFINRMACTPSVLPRRCSSAEKLFTFRKAVSQQESHNTLFGGNMMDIERLLNRVASAIKKDLNL